MMFYIYLLQDECTLQVFPNTMHRIPWENLGMLSTSLKKNTVNSQHAGLLSQNIFQICSTILLGLMPSFFLGELIFWQSNYKNTNFGGSKCLGKKQAKLHSSPFFPPGNSIAPWKFIEWRPKMLVVKKPSYLENLVYHFFRQLWLVLGAKLMEINSNWFSRYFLSQIWLFWVSKC